MTCRCARSSKGIALLSKLHAQQISRLYIISFNELYKFIVRPFPGIPRYVNVGLVDTVRFPTDVMVYLDCKHYAQSTFGNKLNESSIKWFKEKYEVLDNSTFRGITLSASRQTLLIDRISITSGSEDGTESSYTCKVCSNGVNNCSAATTNVSVIGMSLIYI